MRLSSVKHRESLELERYIVSPLWGGTGRLLLPIFLALAL